MTVAKLVLATVLASILMLAAATAVAAAKGDFHVPGFAGYKSRYMYNTSGGGDTTAFRWTYTDGLTCVGTNSGSPTCNWDAYNKQQR